MSADTPPGAGMAEDPLDGHFATCLWRVSLRLWRWRFDFQLHRVETDPSADAPRGWEVAVHFWRNMRKADA